ncbi:ATP-NAD kinase [Rozella allomycis CSF55]|uniref:ATP-NAD kinase n=1 Tax=Rozella allomycis (strain CSF55) TaxID=988480 RepID=A0A075AVU0_ROZAC|nr:Inorganic polyphosphate/ATP-NAD kinase 1 domain-containing protein [Rozella allomycis CSF55]RKP18085.1 ATP-NAD kinase [Rozella allomycis CSF55]|eukprot:EPZ34265.1 Inorganic polyphosphate/ATP-NAD kinase 1 domain-containing protein [Rozella allomycis CSF55]
MSRAIGMSIHRSLSKTPTKKIIETSVNVREAAKNIGKVQFQFADMKNVMVIQKTTDDSLIPLSIELCSWLINQHKVNVYMDSTLKNDFESSLKFKDLMVDDKVRYWNQDSTINLADVIDLIITLGGDGTVLHAAWLFQKFVPPILPFHFGSLGFLTCFSFADYKNNLKRLVEEGSRFNLRMRFECTIYRYNPKHSTNIDEDSTCRPCRKSLSLKSPTDRFLDELLQVDLDEVDNPDCYKVENTLQVLNEVMIDRGPSSYMSILELYGNLRHLTTVQADGLAIATPTGSTAYSLSAGGSIVHPEVPAMLVTPICPHTLSFRPMLLPDSMELRVQIPPDSRNRAWVCFDGRNRVELRQGDYISIVASKYPVPTLCLEDQTSDWFHSLIRCLKWNQRERQRPFFVNSESNSPNPYS